MIRANRCARIALRIARATKVKDGAPDATQIRPLDIFVLLRVLSSAHRKMLRPWALGATLLLQFAVRGGILLAVGSLGAVAEMTLAKSSDACDIAVDFQKLYNMLAPKAAAEIAKHMGLSMELAEALIGPLVACCQGLLAIATKCLYVDVDAPKGLPQGLATSVMLAELCIATLYPNLASH